MSSADRVTRDIVEGHLSEQALRYAKEFSENLIQTANVIIVGLDTDGNVNLFTMQAKKLRATLSRS